MSQNAARIDRGGNDVQKAGPGDMVMDQKKIAALAGTGTQAITAAMILAGIISRTGPVAGYADTFPAADDICAACPGFDTGDSFEFLFINTVAFANTPTAGAGITLVNSGVTASLIKRFMVTCLAGGRATILSGNTTNASPTVTFTGASGFPSASQVNTFLKSIQPGMIVSGTGITGGTTVLAVNSSTGTITLSANATATSVNGVALTFTPSIEIRGLYQAAA